MRAEDLQKRLDERPFDPFRIHLVDGSTINVTEPGMVIVGLATAVLPSQFGADEQGRPVAEL